MHTHSQTENYFENAKKRPKKNEFLFIFIFLFNVIEYVDHIAHTHTPTPLQQQQMSTMFLSGHKVYYFYIEFSYQYTIV